MTDTLERPSSTGRLVTDLGPTEFRSIIADPPWPFKDRGSRVCPEHEGCSNGYTLMTLEDIARLDVAAVSAPDAILFLWTTWNHLADSSALFVAGRWGYAPVTVVPWIKVSRGASTASYKDHPALRLLTDSRLRIQIGMGHYVRGASEPLVVCVRRPCRLPPTRMLPGIIAAPKRKHSRKPEAAYEFAETMTDGPRLELFARSRREGWTAWGDGVAAAGAVGASAQPTPVPEEASP